MPSLVFPSSRGGPLDGINCYHRDFLPCVEAAGLRRITFHSLRHTYASHLIQAGASLAYVKEQMGHSSIQVTVDTYGHLVPGADIAWADKLDAPAASEQLSATHTQPLQSERGAEASQLLENIGGPARIRTWDQRIMSSPGPIETKENKPFGCAKQGEVRKKTQPTRNRDPRGTRLSRNCQTAASELSARKPCEDEGPAAAKWHSH
jgi:integrase-like protein